MKIRFDVKTLLLTMAIAGIAVSALPAQAADAQLRKRMMADIEKLRSPVMKFAADTNSSDDAAAYHMVIGMNLAALGERCEAGKIPAAFCDAALTEIEGYMADNQLSMPEIKPWLERLKPWVN